MGLDVPDWLQSIVYRQMGVDDWLAAPEISTVGAGATNGSL